MTESRATRLRSARKFGNMEIEGRRLIWRGPLCAVLGFFFAEINFTTNFAVFFATNIAVNFATTTTTTTSNVSSTSNTMTRLLPLLPL